MKVKICLTLILVYYFSLFAQSSKDPLEKNLFIGRWKSVSDKNYSIVVNDSTIFEYYGKEITGILIFKIDGDKLIEINKKDKQEFYYSIIRLDKNQLTLLYLDRGNTLRFRRMK